MRILQVITSLKTGGAEKLITDVVPRLHKSGFDVDVCVFNGEETPFKHQLQQCGCYIYELSHNNNYYCITNLIRLWWVMRRYDIVHTHNTAPQLFGAIANISRSTILVTTEHSSNNRRRSWNWYRRIDRWMYSQYKKVICISNQAEKNLRDYLGRDGKNIITIINGVDINSFHSANPDQSLKMDKNRFVVVMVAGFRKEKDQDTLVKAMSHLDGSFELWLVGDGERLQTVKDLAVRLGVQDRVRFLGVRFDIPEILHTADIVVLSSHWEGLSLSSIEGMSVGKPFLASDVDGLREIAHGAGLLFPHQDDQRLASMISELRNNTLLYKRIATACYNRAKGYDIEKMVLSYSRVYRELMDEEDV